MSKSLTDWSRKQGVHWMLRQPLAHLAGGAHGSPLSNPVCASPSSSQDIMFFLLGANTPSSSLHLHVPSFPCPRLSPDSACPFHLLPTGSDVNIPIPNFSKRNETGAAQIRSVPSAAEPCVTGMTISGGASSWGRYQRKKMWGIQFKHPLCALYSTVSGVQAWGSESAQTRLSDPILPLLN